MINYQPSGTACYCGSSEHVEFCATCRTWLVEHSPRYVRQWQWWLRFSTLNRWFSQVPQAQANAAEDCDLAYYLSWRWSNHAQ